MKVLNPYVKKVRNYINYKILTDNSNRKCAECLV